MNRNESKSSAAQNAQQILFQSSLPDVVRQLRNNKQKEKDTIQQAIADIKAEITSTVQNVKVTAVIKLTYFSMLGYSGDYGAFNIIEVMADSAFVNKRVGYVAAAVIFHESTSVLPLITALLKRDLMSQNQYEIGLALYCLSCVCNADLARDLVSDVVELLNHQRSYVRKKAVLCLYKIFIQFPEALRPTYPRLKEKIEDGTDKSDNDPAVRGAIVNVLCELARRNPANFLNLVVPFFSLLSTVHNNWTLIKIVKCFGYFAPHEPRLGKKLVQPMQNLITNTGAKSVQYECIYAVANGMSSVAGLTKLAVEKMKLFVEDHDQNLKFLGLDAMTKFMADNPKLLADQRDTILACLDDADATIRSKALVLLQGMATKKNLVPTVSAMIERVLRFPPDEAWSNQVVAAVVQTAQFDDYANVQDFEWYCGVLLELAQLPLTDFKHGGLLESELVTVLTRVRAIRQFGVECLTALLGEEVVLTSNVETSTQWMTLKAAAFLCGEFPHWLPNKKSTCEALVAQHWTRMPSELQVICVSAAAKIHAYVLQPCERHTALRDGEEDLEVPHDPTTPAELYAILIPPGSEPARPAAASPAAKKAAGNDDDDDDDDDDAAKKNGRLGSVGATPAEGAVAAADLKGLPLFCRSVLPDVQERALFAKHMVALSTAAAAETAAAVAADGATPEAAAAAAAAAVPGAVHRKFYEAELEAVAEGAQRHVPVPEGLDLDAPFSDMPALVAANAAADDDDSADDSGEDDSDDGNRSEDAEAARGQERKVEEARRRERSRRNEVDAFYLRERPSGGRRDDDLPPVERLDAIAPGGVGSVAAALAARSSGRKQHTISRDLSRPANYVAPQGGKGAAAPEEDEATKRLRGISVGGKLGAGDILPVAQPYRRLDPNASPSGRGATAEEEAEAAVHAADDDARAALSNTLVLVDAEPALLSLEYVESKVKKDAVVVRFRVSLTSRLGKHSLYAPRLALAPASAAATAAAAEAETPVAPPRLGGGATNPDGTSLDTEAGAEGILLAEKVKAGETAACDFTVSFASAGDAVFVTPPMIIFRYTSDKKQRALPAVPLPLAARFFMREASLASSLDRATFDTTVLAPLKDVPCLSATLPLPKKKKAAHFYTAIRARLRLSQVDAFKDSASLHGTVVARKSQAEKAHVAVVLQETPKDENGRRGLGVYVKSHTPSLAEQMIQEVAEILAA